MIARLLAMLFGCPHRRTTFPITPAKRAGFSAHTAHKGAYVVCLDCGKEFGYNWQEMKVGEAMRPSVRLAPDIATVATIKEIP